MSSANDEARGEDVAADTAVDSGSAVFRWKQGRENLFTESGLRMFQLAVRHAGEVYETARESIDREYEQLSPRLQKRGRGSLRHGGIFINYFALFREMGLMYLEQEGSEEYLRLTEAGKQAELLLASAPQTLRVVPYFLLELLSRYRFNNPLDEIKKNSALAAEMSESDVFPYWCIYSSMRALENRLSKDELSRFLFRLKHMADLNDMIERVREYRTARKEGATESELNEEYGVPLTGTFAQPKYIMGRAGVQVGVIEQTGDLYKLSEHYVPFVDALLSQPLRVDELTPEAWIRRYGGAVDATAPEFVPFDPDAESEITDSAIDEEDRVYRAVQDLLHQDEYSGVVLVGPPGTGKSWYARQIALRMVEGVESKVREIQFHPSYQYEDFIEGHVPDGKGGFRLANRHLLDMCVRARRDPGPHVIVIDELSRTDPARVMGEALTYMETTLRGTRFYLPSGRAAEIPNNLIFLATMNPEDRSVEELDAAMDRRWGKVSLSPDPSMVSTFLTSNGLDERVVAEVTEFFAWVQRHYKLGHAFFRSVKDRHGLMRLWDNQLVFLFQKAFRYDEDTMEEIQAAWNAMKARLDEQDPSGAS